MRYEIVFRGKLVAGYGEGEVRANLAKLFKKDEGQIAGLFDGSRRVIKSNLDRETADKYRAVLKKAGARVAVVTVKDADEVATPAPDPTPAAPPPPVNRAVFTPAPGPEEKKPLVDRSAGQRAVFTTSPGPEDVPAEAAASPPPLPGAPDDDSTDEPDGLTLAEPGAILAHAQPQEPARIVETVALSLDPEGVVFDDSARPPPAEVPTDHLAAEDIVSPLDAAPRPDEPDIDISTLEFGEEEAPLDTTPPAPPAEYDLEGLEATDVNEPLDETPRPPPPKLDTSTLHLDNT